MSVPQCSSANIPSQREQQQFAQERQEAVVPSMDKRIGVQQSGMSSSLQFHRVELLEDVSHPLLESAKHLYQAAFAKEPYCEAFSDAEAKSALQFILDKKGDLLLGVQEERTVSLAGGYLMNSSYFIEELAVDPEVQGKGLGKTTLKALIEQAKKCEPSKLELRTTCKNVKAIGLYQSCGFTKESVHELVSSFRTDGNVELDERVYLSTNPLSDKEREMYLKRLAVAFPSGNTTAVVFDQLQQKDRKTLNQTICSSWDKSGQSTHEIEQCCFVLKPNHPEAVARVEMFGGEFCGNATRSVVWLLADGKDLSGKIEVSGVDRLLPFSVKEGKVQVEMPTPTTGKIVEEVKEGYLVHLDGITHLVVTKKTPGVTPRKLLEEIQKRGDYRISQEPAFGVSFYDPETCQADFCVYVKEVDTIYDETACGSGTCAIGLACSDKEQTIQELEIIQPSKESIVCIVERDPETGLVTRSSIRGNVRVLYDGEFALSQS